MCRSSEDALVGVTTRRRNRRTRRPEDRPPPGRERRGGDARRRARTRSRGLAPVRMSGAEVSVKTIPATTAAKITKTTSAARGDGHPAVTRTKRSSIHAPGRVLRGPVPVTVAACVGAAGVRPVVARVRVVCASRRVAVACCVGAAAFGIRCRPRWGCCARTGVVAARVAVQPLPPLVARRRWDCCRPRWGCCRPRRRCRCRLRRAAGVGIVAARVRVVAARVAISVAVAASLAPPALGLLPLAFGCCRRRCCCRCRSIPVAVSVRGTGARLRRRGRVRGASVAGRGSLATGEPSGSAGGGGSTGSVGVAGCWGFGSGRRGGGGEEGVGAGQAAQAERGPARMIEARWVLSVTRGPSPRGAVSAGGGDGSATTIDPFDPASLSGFLVARSLPSGRAPAARGREAEPAGRQLLAKARRCGCPERREPRCSERSRHCCSGHRPHLGAEAVPVGRGRSTVRRERRRRGQARRLESRQEPRSHRGLCGCVPPDLHVRKPQLLQPPVLQPPVPSNIGVLGSEGVPHRGSSATQDAKGRHHKPVPWGPRRRV